MLDLPAPMSPTSATVRDSGKAGDPVTRSSRQNRPATLKGRTPIR
jgi:hypothetical protein